MRPLPWLAPASALLVAACIEPAHGPVVGAPRDFPGFPASSTDEIVWAEATFYTNHSHAFGTDLTLHGYVPVALRIGVGRSDGTLRRISRESFDARMYLQDGTALSWVPPDEVEHRRELVCERVVEQALPLATLPEWEQAEEGFVFFRFEKPGVRVQGSYALSSPPSLAGEFHRELELPQSLVSFTVVGADGPEVVFVGLHAGRYEPR